MCRLLQMLGICLAVLLLNSCFDNSKYDPEPYVRSLEIIKLSEQDYVHVSYLKDNYGGYIPCNGYIRVEGNEAFIFDTPLNDTLSGQLITFVQEDLKATIKGVQVSHSHIDGAGGINAFAKAKIPTYGSAKTAALLAKDSLTISNPFSQKDSIKIAENFIVMEYLGPAHSDDNSIAYIRASDILLGGCMIKPLDGTKGNLADANLDEWANTVTRLQNHYPKVVQVIPGHGGRGDKQLLDYTISMFQKSSKVISDNEEIVEVVTN